MFKLKNSVGISFEHDPDNEFDDFKWVSYWYPMFKIIFFKKDVYRKVLGDMRYAYFDKGLL
jgi:putative (di)nucleoside polyphosphate hydrolase